MLVDRVVYDNWVRGEFGSPDVPQAQQLGRNLLRAQTFTKQEVAEGRDNATLAEQKKADFGALAGQMGDRYTYFQGKSGSRIGVGVLAVIQAACIALFQLLSKVLVLTALLLLRLMVMTAPAIAVVAVLKPEILPALLRVAGAAIVNTIVVGALAGLHALLVVTLFRPGSGIDLWLALLVTGVVTVVLWAVARPFRRLVSMVSLTNEQFGGIVPGAGTGPMSRVWQPGARRRGRRPPVPLVGGAAFRGRGRAGYDSVRPEAEPVVAQAYPAGAGPRTPRRRTEVDAPARPSIPAARRPALPAGPDGVGERLGRPRAGPTRGRSTTGDLPQAGRRAAAPGGRAPGDPRARRRRAGLPDLPAGRARPAYAGAGVRRRRVGRAPVPIRTPRAAPRPTARCGSGRCARRPGSGSAWCWCSRWWSGQSPGSALRGTPRSARSPPAPGVGDGDPAARSGGRPAATAGPTVLPPVPVAHAEQPPAVRRPSPGAVRRRALGGGLGRPSAGRVRPDSGSTGCGRSPRTSTWACWPAWTRRTSRRPRVTGDPGRPRSRPGRCRSTVPTNALTLDVLVVLTEDGLAGRRLRRGS